MVRFGALVATSASVSSASLPLKSPCGRRAAAAAGRRPRGARRAFAGRPGTSGRSARWRARPLKYSHSAHESAQAGASGIGWNRSISRRAAAGDCASTPRSALVSRQRPRSAAVSRIAERAFEAGHAAAAVHADALCRRSTDTGRRSGWARPRDARAQRLGLQRARQQQRRRRIAAHAHHHVAAADEVAATAPAAAPPRATPSRMAITATPAPKPTASTRAAHRMRGQRAQRQPADHRARLAFDAAVAHRQHPRARATASVWSWVTMTSAVPSRVHAVEQLRDVLAGGLVQLAGGLVGQQQARLVGERARDRHALHLAARELRRAVVGARRQARRIQQLARARLAVARRRRRPRTCGSSTFSAARQHRQQEEALEDEADRAQPQQAALAVRQRRPRRGPRTAACPADGVSTQPSMWSSVDLPQPDGPRTATWSPAAMSSDTSRTATTGPDRHGERRG